MDAAQNLIASAISQGAPAYNRGDVEGCARLYAQTAEQLLLLEQHELSGSSRTQLQQALRENTSSDASAWALRRALDEVAASLGVGGRGIGYTERAKQVRIRAPALQLGPRQLEWYVLNDGVMGGQSQSALVPTDDGGMIFHGNISLDGGGFASCRTLIEGPETLGLGQRPRALRVKVSGDGQQFKVGLRATDGFREPTWQAAFDTTAGEVTEAVLPFDADTWSAAAETGQWLPVPCPLRAVLVCSRLLSREPHTRTLLRGRFGSVMGRKVQLPPGAAIEWAAMRGVGFMLSFVDVHGRNMPRGEKFHDGPFAARVHSLSLEA